MALFDFLKKNNDPFEKLMVKVCPGMFDQKSYDIYSKDIYPGGDRRRKPEATKYYPKYYCRRVTISKEYQICKYPVTQAQWKTIMGEGFNMSEFRGDDLPVTNISYDDIMQFIEKLNKLTGKKYRLPTEAEWQWAAMGANKDKDQGKYAGCNKVKDLDKYAWYNENSKSKPHPVGKKKPNELGLYDMTGNVSECCQDKLKRVLGNEPVIDPMETEGSCHISKGGGYGSDPNCNYMLIQREPMIYSDGTTSDLASLSSHRNQSYYGFRLAL